MGARGRKTAGDLAVAKRSLEAMGLPPPPTFFREAEAQEWEEIVRSCPPDRFPRSTWPMLEGYCRHTVQTRRIGKMIDILMDRIGEGDDVDVDEYNKLLTMLGRETKLVASFGVRLGIARTSMAGRHNNDPDEAADTGAPWDA